jgi:putative oxidoreductase
LKPKKNNYVEALAFIIKLILGISFIYASFHKIENPEAFAKILYGYDIFPEVSINILAILVPFIELITGFSLISGWFPRSALLIINVLLAMFIMIIGFNLIRGHQFDCGCFSVSGHSQTASNVFLLIRDMFMLAGGIFLFKKTKVS